ncbi:DUF3043 domain-containing protein [Corynebacterium sp. ES2775-CONJ]|uniref:DUF3043 domain-containing protein n=1 Tax=Corynebacterium sp. ES2775-CONJ TaxID=2974029 RepID=UPI0021692554|nr:DUF3043 domain-containing protein [Corynebacterium sp. ES2775-CONJ]MCS4488981.1 DUF3043 domain-containing protein [Corynebacterium sp. ES2775-CONJ]
MNSDKQQPAEAPRSKAYTPKKGRPTPKRKEAQAHPGTFQSRYASDEAFLRNRKMRKELKASMTKEEWKAHKKAEKEARLERSRRTKEGMDRGEERYLLERDKGPERAYVRDYIDSRRYMNSFMMPFALILLIGMVISSSWPEISYFISLFAMAVMIGLAVEGVMLGRGAVAAVRDKFPASAESGLALGFYAFGRASQPRRWRTPKPKVAAGDYIGGKKKK